MLIKAKVGASLTICNPVHEAPHSSQERLKSLSLFRILYLGFI